MKKTRLFFFFCIAISIAAVSCQEGPIDNPDPGKDHPTGPRTLTVSIAATKTSLNGEQPEWSENDAIWVKGITDGKDSVYTVPQEAIGCSKFELTTWIEGELVAVYPASAKADESPYFSVEHDQDGSFAKANICVATAPETADELKFYNKTALFEIRVPEGTTKLTVSSLAKITTSDGQRGAEKVPINNSESSDINEIVVFNNGETIPDTCFISVLTDELDEYNNVILTDLNFDITYDGKSAMGGFPPNKLRGVTDTDNSVESVCNRHIKKNEHYILGKQYFHEYLSIQGGKPSKPTYTKWATMNIGATTETDGGDYFAWGETRGHKANNAHNGFQDEHYFAWSNCPYYIIDPDLLGYTLFTKYVLLDDNAYTDPDNHSILFLYDDAAFANWGGAWRMPVENEMVKLSQTQDFSGVNGSYYGETPNRIFIPAAGEGEDAQLTNYNIQGRYWTSSVYNSNNSWGVSFEFYDASGNDNTERRKGRSIRPIVGKI